MFPPTLLHTASSYAFYQTTYSLSDMDTYSKEESAFKPTPLLSSSHDGILHKPLVSGPFVNEGDLVNLVLTSLSVFVDGGCDHYIPPKPDSINGNDNSHLFTVEQTPIGVTQGGNVQAPSRVDLSIHEAQDDLPHLAKAGNEELIASKTQVVTVLDEVTEGIIHGVAERSLQQSDSHINRPRDVSSNVPDDIARIETEKVVYDEYCGRVDTAKPIVHRHRDVHDCGGQSNSFAITSDLPVGLLMDEWLPDKKKMEDADIGKEEREKGMEKEKGIYRPMILDNAKASVHLPVNSVSLDHATDKGQPHYLATTSDLRIGFLVNETTPSKEEKEKDASVGGEERQKGKFGQGILDDVGSSLHLSGNPISLNHATGASQFNNLATRLDLRVNERALNEIKKENGGVGEDEMERDVEKEKEIYGQGMRDDDSPFHRSGNLVSLDHAISEGQFNHGATTMDLLPSSLVNERLLNKEEMEDVNVGKEEKEKEIYGRMMRDDVEPPLHRSGNPVSLIHASSSVQHQTGTNFGVDENLLVPLATARYENRKTVITLHIGAQPNNSPHAGTMTVFTSAFALARRLLDTCQTRFKDMKPSTGQSAHDLSVNVQLDLVDTCPDDNANLGEYAYRCQRSHRFTESYITNKDFLDYQGLLKTLSGRYGVSYIIKYQKDLLALPGTPSIIRNVLNNRDRISTEISPQKISLGLRCACPVKDCGLSDKHGVRNEYNIAQDHTTITFCCPIHGPHTITLEKPDEIIRLEMNTPLRNLVRTLAYSEISATSTSQETREFHLRVTGADYCGFYQEQLLWRQLLLLSQFPQPPIFLYAPLIVDWAGSKLSKSLYVKKGAYTYMKNPNTDFLLSYKEAREQKKDLSVLFDEVDNWLLDPNEWIRTRSVEYMRMTFEDISRERGPFELFHDDQVHDPLGSGSYAFEKEVALPLLRYLGCEPSQKTSCTVERQSHPFDQLSWLVRFFTRSFFPPSITNVIQSKVFDTIPRQFGMFIRNLSHSFGLQITDSTSRLPTTLILHLDARADSSPTAANITCMAVAFCLGKILKQKHNDRSTHREALQLEAIVEITLTGDDSSHRHEYEEIAQKLQRFFDEQVTFVFKDETNFLRGEFVQACLRRVMEDLGSISPLLAPHDEALGIECTCRSSSHSILNSDTFPCPQHEIDLASADNRSKLKLPVNLRNLLRSLVYAKETVSSRRTKQEVVHMRIVGWEHAGIIAEQCLWNPLFKLKDEDIVAAPPVTFYAPLVVDWSGAKLSKSLYHRGAYDYMKKSGKEYLLSYQVMKDEGKDVEILFEIVKDWVREPKKLFRPYSEEYLHREFLKRRHQSREQAGDTTSH